MTDVSTSATSVPVPGRLGVTARYIDDELILEHVAVPQTMHHGIVRASVLSFLVDAVAGIPIDEDPDVWSLTSDMTVRMRPVPAPTRVRATGRILRQTRRSVTSHVEVVSDTGAPIATGVIGFIRVARKATEGPKPVVTPEMIVRLFDGDVVERPLREEAGIEVIDAAQGVVQVELSPLLMNPAGTLQGAMVALVAESAAEELMAARFGSPFVVTDLDLRYLSRTQAGPIRASARLLGDGPDSALEIELVDLSTDTLTTLVHARAAVVPDPRHG